MSERESLFSEAFVKHIYLEEIKLQCEYALQAFNEIKYALKQGYSKELFRAAHHFLVHVGNVSKILWPSREKEEYKQKRAECRAKTMRDIIGISESDHPLKGRKLRNHLEHYDTRLDDWSENSVNRVYVDMNVAPRGEIQVGGSENYLRNFDPNTFNYSFVNEEFELQLLAAAIDQISSTIKEELEKSNSIH